MTSLLQKINELNVRVDNVSTSGGGDTTALQAQVDTNTTDVSGIQINKQDKLTAGDNISIIGNTISSLLDANFSSLNASTITTTGDVSIGGFLYPKLPCFSATYSGTQTDITSTQNVPYNSIVIDNQNGYDTSDYIYTIQTTGFYYIYWPVIQSGNNAFAVLLQRNSFTLDRSRADAEGGDRTEGAQRMTIAYCTAGQNLRMRLTFGGIRMNDFCSWGAFLFST